MTLQHIAAAAAGLLGATGVGLGAFGAHALKDVLQGGRASLWSTASHYHLLHAVALAAAAALMTAQAQGGSSRGGVATLCVIGFVVGTALFSGSLYALALGAPRGVGAVTPVGGLLLILGWLLLGALGWLAR